MGQQQHVVINLDGGLDLVSTHTAHQLAPGSAKSMVNFESAVNAGYRRIRGYAKFGTTQPTGTSTQILGCYPYADGIVAIAGDGVYFSVDGITWLQLNRDTYVAQTGTVAVTLVTAGYNKVDGTGTAFTSEFNVGDHVRIDGNIRQISSIISDTEMYLEEEIAGGVTAGEALYKNGDSSLAGTVIPRTGQGRATFAWYASDTRYGSLVFSDELGVHDLGHIKITGSGGAREYEYEVLNSDFAAPSKPKYVTQFKERIVVGNDADDEGNISWSERLSNKRFDGAGSGTAQLDSPILNVTSLRDRVVIFSRNNIHQLVNIDTDPAILPIAYNTGCVSGWSVQEIGGDVVFLAPDGIRTLSTSDQYGDVQFGNIARKIDPIVSKMVKDADNLTFSSSVFRKENQYRLFYTKNTNADEQQLGLTGTLKRNSQGVMEFQWSRISGMPVAYLQSISNNFLNLVDVEKHYQGGYDGYVYQHNVGTSFDGNPVQSLLELNEIDYGDAGMRKTFHYVTIFGDADEIDSDQILMDVQYDYNSAETAQPKAYVITTILGVTEYGTAIYDTSRYGGTSDFNRRILIEGSAYTNRFVFASYGTAGRFNLNSLYVDLRVGSLI